MNCKKILAGILSAAMVFTTMAIPAFADDNGNVASIGAINYNTLTAAITAAKDNETVTLLSDVTESITVEKDKNITLDLNGYKLTNTDKEHTITNYGTLTIKDSSNGSGTVDNVSNGRAALINDEDATATLNGGTFKRSKEAGTYTPHINGGNSYYTIENSGTMSIYDGVTVKNAGGYSSNIINVGKSENNASLTIYNGVFSGGVNSVKNDAYGVLKINNGKFFNTVQDCIMNWYKATINGGVFTALESADSVVYNGSYNDMKGDLTITGGTFTGAIVAVNYKGQATADPVTSISGGTFDTDVTDYCAEGYALKANKDGSYTVANVEDLTRMVAKIDSKYYETLTDAIAAAENSDTVTLLSNVTESITVKKGKNITLDLNGKTLTNVEGNDTIKNYGTLTIEDNSTDKNGKVDNVSNGKAALVNYEGGNVTLNGSKFDRSLENSKVGNTADCNSYYTIKNWGVMTINAGVVVNNNSNTKGGSSAIGNGYYNGNKFDFHEGVTAKDVNAKLTINGGKFTGGFNTIKNDDWGNSK